MKKYFQAGYTFAEILVVIFVIAVIASISLPQFKFFRQGQSEQEQIDRCYQTLLYLQKSARSSAYDLALGFNVGSSNTPGSLIGLEYKNNAWTKIQTDWSEMKADTVDAGRSLWPDKILWSNQSANQEDVAIVFKRGSAHFNEGLLMFRGNKMTIVLNEKTQTISQRGQGEEL